LLAHASQLGFEGAVFGDQFGADGSLGPVVATFPSLRAVVADAQFTGDLVNGLVGA
jgi:hypothetical protein